MNNDMKLIMEAWARFVEQEGEKVVLRPPNWKRYSREPVQLVPPPEWKFSNMRNPFSEPIEKFYEWYDDQDTTLRVFVDLFVPVAGQLVDIREAVEAYEKWEEWYLLDEDHPMKYGPAAERLGISGPSLLTDAIIAVILAIPGFDILEGVGLGYKQIKRALGGGSVSEKLRKLTKGSMAVTAPAALAYASIPYAMDSPDQKPQLGPGGLPFKIYSDKMPKEVVDEWKRKKNRQAKEALEALDKLEAHEAKIKAEMEADKQRRSKAAKAGQERYDDMPSMDLPRAGARTQN